MIRQFKHILIKCSQNILKKNLVYNSTCSIISTQKFHEQTKNLPKVKLYLKECLLLFKQGSIDTYKEFKWLVKLILNKNISQNTGFELRERTRIKFDLIKFIPFSIYVIGPGAELFLPLQLVFFPNSIPTQYTFDYTWVKYIENAEKKQRKAQQILQVKLRKFFRKKGMKEEDFTSDNQRKYKKEFRKNLLSLDKELNIKDFSSDELLKLADFFSIKVISGTYILTKLCQIIRKLPCYLINCFLRLASSKKRIDVSKINPEIKLNFGIFEPLKKKLILAQINFHLKNIKKQDIQLKKFGMDDIKGKDITNFARERGIPSIACYESLKAFVSNQWVNKTIDYTNNQMIWQAVVLYDILELANQDPLVSIKPQTSLFDINVATKIDKSRINSQQELTKIQDENSKFAKKRSSLPVQKLLKKKKIYTKKFQPLKLKLLAFIRKSKDLGSKSGKMKLKLKSKLNKFRLSSGPFELKLDTKKELSQK